jgi:GntR family histidine utilization transcriptional repressor
MLDIVSMATEIPARGQTYLYSCLTQSIVAADGALATLLGVEAGSPLRYVLGAHRADGEVVELEERWINPGVLPSAETQDFSEVAPGQWLLSVTPWTEAEHTVGVTNADPELAETLGVDEGAACLVLERRTFQEDRVVTFARLTWPGDRHRLTGRFTPAGAPAQPDARG